jgi:hypothetical protein
MAIPFSSLVNLLVDWHALNDVDRGRAVLAIHRNGTSLRHLTRKLDYR